MKYTFQQWMAEVKKLTPDREVNDIEAQFAYQHGITPEEFVRDLMAEDDNYENEDEDELDDEG